MPGTVRQTPGGVARNIAEAALHLLQEEGGACCCSGGGVCSGRQQHHNNSSCGCGGGGKGACCGGGSPVELITVLGGDAAGDALAAHLRGLG